MGLHFETSLLVANAIHCIQVYLSVLETLTYVNRINQHWTTAGGSSTEYIVSLPVWHPSLDGSFEYLAM